MNSVESRIEELEKGGWTRQFVANEPRLSEAADMYRQLGYEVHLEPLPKEPECESCGGAEGQDETAGCRLCFEGVEDQYKIIFTRPLEGKERGDDELF